jgi:ADP-ribosylglycohydrolase
MGSDEKVMADRVRGCLLGGAIGDALGANVEFDSLDVIRDRTGGGDVVDFLGGMYPAGSITDDTQMTLFTAEGLIRASQQHRADGVWEPVSALRRAYLRWLVTQTRRAAGDDQSGLLANESVLHARRAPGMTCVSALEEGGTGSTTNRRNDSKGCGGVMRVAPIGVLSDPTEAFELAAAAAAITHGHPTGFLAAGAFAAVIHGCLRDVPLPRAIDDALQELRVHADTTETVSAIEAACDLARNESPTPDAVEQLGGGWIAEEALAIALFCALAAPSPRDALTLAVTHSGDSDSTGAICGNVLGAAGGVGALPADLLNSVEARGLIEDVADDLYTAVVENRQLDIDRYPPRP